MHDRIHDEMHDEIRDEIHDGIHDGIRDGIHDEIRDEMHDGIHDEIRDEMRDEIRYEIPGEPLFSWEPGWLRYLCIKECRLSDPMLPLHRAHNGRRFSNVVEPPLQTGMMWPQ